MSVFDPNSNDAKPPQAPPPELPPEPATAPPPESPPESTRGSTHAGAEADGGAPLRSVHASDPDMAELVAFFVEEMADRVEVIRNAATENDLGRLRVVAHQLKGAGTGYGFEPISRSAAALEQLIDSVDHDGSIDDLSQQVDELIGLCRRASV